MTKDTLEDNPGPSKREPPGVNSRPDRRTDLVWDGMIPGQPHEENTVHIARHRTGRRQAGMVRHWFRLKGPNWRRSPVVNATGAVVTFIVTLVIGWTKFSEGAWMVIVVTPIIVAACLLIKSHYRLVAKATAPETPLDPGQIRLRMIVPIGSLNLPVQQALALARAISPNVTGVHVTDDIEEARQIQRQWEERADGSGQLVIIESPYRSLVGPLLAYLDTVRAQNPSDTIMVVLPEFVPSRWWEHLLHNQTAFLLKAALLFRPGVVVADVPYHIRRSTSHVIGKPADPNHNGEPAVHIAGRTN